MFKVQNKNRFFFIRADKEVQYFSFRSSVLFPQKFSTFLSVPRGGTLRNHVEKLQKLPWFPAEVAVISWRSCRDFLKKLPWFPEEVTVISWRSCRDFFRRGKKKLVKSLHFASFFCIFALVISEASEGSLWRGQMGQMGQRFSRIPRVPRVYAVRETFYKTTVPSVPSVFCFSVWWRVPEC